MEDELIKNTNQIWKKLRGEGGILGKLRSILGEIFVIGFAFSFSILVPTYQNVLDFAGEFQSELKREITEMQEETWF
jgi:hypothetical protein